MLKIDEQLNRIDIWDERWYQRTKDKFYPSSTFVLGVYPKGPSYEQFLKDVGNSAKYILERAGESGTKVHDTIHERVSGNAIRFDPDKYTELEWAGVCRFMEFYERYKPEVVATEMNVFSDKYEFAGTLDLVADFNGQRWLIDYKFTNGIHSSHFLQIASYRMALEEMGEKVDKMGILWLKAKTRTEGNGDAIQGKGWQLIEPKKDYEHLKDIFLKTLAIFREEYPNAKPSHLSYPLEFRP